MIYRKLDSTGDYVLGKGIFAFHKNTPETVAQAVQTVLRLFQGEWFLNKYAGVPYSTKVFGFGNMFQYDIAIKAAILNVTGVTEITNYSSYFNSQTRQVSISVTINTTYGQALVSTIL